MVLSLFLSDTKNEWTYSPSIFLFFSLGVPGQGGRISFAVPIPDLVLWVNGVLFTLSFNYS